MYIIVATLVQAEKCLNQWTPLPDHAGSIPVPWCLISYSWMYCIFNLWRHVHQQHNYCLVCGWNYCYRDQTAYGKNSIFLYLPEKQCTDAVRQMDINLVREKREKAAFWNCWLVCIGYWITQLTPQVHLISCFNDKCKGDIKSVTQTNALLKVSAVIFVSK